MTDRDKKCEELIDEQLDRTVTEIRAVFRFEELLEKHNWSRDSWREDLIEMRLCKDLDQDDARELWDELLKCEKESGEQDVESYVEGILSADKLYTVYRIQMSWGGPSDEFEVFVDDDNDIDHIDYLYKDWFDGARRTLHGDDLEVVERLAQHVLCLEC